MRHHGSRIELLPLRPNDHIGWVYSGLDEFVGLTLPFLEEGASRQERLMFVADDPGRPAFGELTSRFDPETLQIASVSEVYGPSGVVDPDRQRRTFVDAMKEALDEGYTGIRVAADNSSLVDRPARLEAWIRWELVADRMMCENQVTGLCAFDRHRVAIDTLRHLATLHPLSSAAEPAPQFLLFAEPDGLCIEGEVDSTAVDHLWLALKILPPKTKVKIDLTRARLRGRAARAGLEHLRETGVDFTVVGAPATV